MGPGHNSTGNTWDICDIQICDVHIWTDKGVHRQDVYYKHGRHSIYHSNIPRDWSKTLFLLTRVSGGGWG